VRTSIADSPASTLAFFLRRRDQVGGRLGPGRPGRAHRDQHGRYQHGGERARRRNIRASAGHFGKKGRVRKIP
jgi:hypothetical protein